MAIVHRIKPRFRSKAEQIIAELRSSVGAGPPIDPAMKIKRLTAEIAVQMALIHGGDWRVDVQPEAGFVLVARRL